MAVQVSIQAEIQEAYISSGYMPAAVVTKPVQLPTQSIKGEGESEIVLGPFWFG